LIAPTEYPSPTNDAITSVDVTFNVESDAGGKDPDQHSATLRRYHQILWSKPLPDGTPFRLEADGQHAYLRYATTAGYLYLASDSIVHSYRNAFTNKIGDVMAAVDPHLVARIYDEGSTIGGYTLFPGDVRDRKPTINGARGMHPRIADRFDLTLECIRRHYAAAESPLGAALARYRDFFALYRDFRGYVEFFLLQDLVDDADEVRFYLPFDDFERSPLPLSVDEYETYASGVLTFLRRRNQRIAEWSSTNTNAPEAQT